MKFSIAALAISCSVASATHISTAPGLIQSTPLGALKFDDASLVKDDTADHYTLTVPLSYEKKSDIMFEVRYHVDSSNFDGSNEAPIMIQMVSVDKCPRCRTPVVISESFRSSLRSGFEGFFRPFVTISLDWYGKE